MNCPRCGNDMAEFTKHGVVIDMCSSCGGMWLDKGELAKITVQLREAEASLDQELASIRERQQPRERAYERDEHKHHDPDRYDRERSYRRYDDHKYKKKSGFERLFDIFD